MRRDILLCSEVTPSITPRPKVKFVIHDKNSLLVQQCAQNSYEFDLDDIQIMDRCSQLLQRFILEMWHSMRDQNAINEYIQIPDMYTIFAYP